MPSRWAMVMASLLLVSSLGLFGCENPSSKEVASMIAAPQGEGVSSLLRGIDYKVDGTKIDVGSHRLEIFPYVEQCTDTESDHICGVRFEVTEEGTKQPSLTYGVVGTGKTMDAALQHAVGSWWAEFTVPLIVSLSGKNLDFTQTSIIVYPGSMAIRGAPPGGWLDGSQEMHGRIVPALNPVVRDKPPTKVVSLMLVIRPDGVKDLGSRIDGIPSQELVKAVSALPWPKSDKEYVFYQTYFFRHKGES
ncbi:MAG: hypothetical protein HOP22_08265 [Nitrospiraceae bacterium]|nr:hypothetical protein [Nitrospiraceae bacterium]